MLSIRSIIGMASYTSRVTLTNFINRGTKDLVNVPEDKKA